ncbi:MAG: DUF302 domain-containing protein [Rhodocyclaceae bacterium]|nr:DUF302 domain-containing protein [Rhodocyclaceae bacterium]
MQTINFKRVIETTLDEAIARATQALAAEGFGVLTRIDMHAKIKEKTGETIVPTVILGACHPQLALTAYRECSDVASLLPCNAVVREIAPGKISLEFVKPTAMLAILGDPKLQAMAAEADKKIERAISSV